MCTEQQETDTCGGKAYDFSFITYLYKEHIRKTQEWYISLRFHYSLVFDLSPTLRQIVSIQLFFVTRRILMQSDFQWNNGTEPLRTLIFYDLRQ